jgi:hypothetical protein
VARLLPLLRRLLPWIVSAAALGYVFGRTDWSALLEATRQANLPLFIAVTTADKLVFFVVWTYLQTIAVQRFVTRVPFRSVLAIRGGSELLRALSNPLADGAFLVGLAQLARWRADAVLAAALIPFTTHLLVLLIQASVALPFLDGGPGENRDVAVAAITGWTFVGIGALAVRLGPALRIPGASQLGRFIGRVPLSRMAPFLWWFLGLAIFDVAIQGLASRSFGVPIDWVALMARIPMLYAALSIPSFGNYGVREVTWAALFADFGPHDKLVAYAFATNTVFLLLNVLIGVVFVRRAFELVNEIRRARASGEPVPAPLLHDAADP